MKTEMEVPMKRIIVLSLAVLALAAAPRSAEAARYGFAFGYHGGGRAFVRGPALYGGWYWDRPYYLVPVGYPNAGEIKIDTNARDAGVYINGAYAGTVGHLKTVWLRSGTYDIEVRNTNGGVFDQKVFVPVDKKIVIEPVFTVAAR
jgi:hypothetical protein